MLDALSNAASAVTGAVAGAAKNALFLVAEKVIKEHTGRDIEVTSENVPSDWNEWMAKTGVNSLCSDWTWNFISNDRKKALFNERNITKIIMTVDESPDPDMKYETCYVTWETGSTTFKITWLPKAGDWESDNSWLESGYKRWWNIGDEIEFALQLYQLPGKCFYKSDWLENFEDVDPEGFLPTSTKKFARWFQFRHWVIFWYAEARWGWNYQWTETPPPLPDGSLFSLDAVLKLPSMPDLKMPNIKLPSLPNVSMPSLPSISAPSLPSISAPSLSMPSLSAPSLSMPSMPERKMRPKSKWDAHGIIELEDMKVKAKGSTLILSNCCITNFWERKDGGYDDEEKEHQRLELKCTNEEQAESWKLTLMASGVEEGEVGGCCTVA